MATDQESIWLRPRVIQMRALLRHVKDARVEAVLREFIAEARLELLDERTTKSTNRTLAPSALSSKMACTVIVLRFARRHQDRSGGGQSTIIFPFHEA